jgi:uncharacterized protein YutE (UPF0331/DUF86 family)
MTQAELESVKLEQIASEYRRKGYEVSVHPDTGDMPEFLAPFRPDLVAASAHDRVVVEVKSSAGVASSAIVKLADAVEMQPGWRLEVVVVNPSAAQEVPAGGELVSADRVASLIREAQVLSREKRYEAATIIAWAAAEAMLRRLARASGESEGKSSATVLKQLYAHGVIDEDQYDSFSRAMEFRNAFAHGFSADVAPEAIERFIHDVEELKSLSAA